MLRLRTSRLFSLLLLAALPSCALDGEPALGDFEQSIQFQPREHAMPPLPELPLPYGAERQRTPPVNVCAMTCGYSSGNRASGAEHFEQHAATTAAAHAANLSACINLCEPGNTVSANGRNSTRSNCRVEFDGCSVTEVEVATHDSADLGSWKHQIESACTPAPPAPSGLRAAPDSLLGGYSYDTSYENVCALTCSFDAVDRTRTDPAQEFVSEDADSLASAYSKAYARCHNLCAPGNTVRINGRSYTRESCAVAFSECTKTRIVTRRRLDAVGKPAGEAVEHLRDSRDYTCWPKSRPPKGRPLSHTPSW